MLVMRLEGDLPVLLLRPSGSLPATFRVVGFGLGGPSLRFRGVLPGWAVWGSGCPSGCPRSAWSRVLLGLPSAFRVVAGGTFRHFSGSPRTSS